MNAPPVPASPLAADARIVLIRFGSLGDVVKSTALPRLIKAAYPRCHLTFVTNAAYLELIADNPFIDQPIALPSGSGWAGVKALAGGLRRNGIDLTVDVHRSLRSRLLSWLARAPVASYSKRTAQRWLLIHFRINTYGLPSGKEQDFLAPLAAYGIRDDGQGTRLYLARIAADPAVRARLGDALDLLRRWRATGRPILGLAPVAAWALKCWPMDHFRALVAEFLSRTGGGVVVFGGAGDAEAHALADGRAERVLSLVGRTTHLESAYFASLTDLVVANDTGMTHLAEAAGRDVIALYGPTSRELGYYPTRPGSIALERALPCRPCTRMGEGRCTHPLHKACLVGITPDFVLDAVLRKLRQDTGHAGGSAAPEAAC